MPRGPPRAASAAAARAFWPRPPRPPAEGGVASPHGSAAEPSETRCLPPPRAPTRPTPTYSPMAARWSSDADDPRLRLGVGREERRHQPAVERHEKAGAVDDERHRHPLRVVIVEHLCSGGKRRRRRLTLDARARATTRTLTNFDDGDRALEHRHAEEGSVNGPGRRSCPRRRPSSKKIDTFEAATGTRVLREKLEAVAATAKDTRCGAGGARRRQRTTRAWRRRAAGLRVVRRRWRRRRWRRRRPARRATTTCLRTRSSSAIVRWRGRGDPAARRKRGPGDLPSRGGFWYKPVALVGARPARPRAAGRDWSTLWGNGCSATSGAARSADP